ncbi:hypothetical protein ACFYXM_26975 [Streptomyces sp. NPDC002476]|uniref:hypothetical protein n=1 Tax=Streptomyces sp. NPDC002476 TaxID=3364648 RepID=UPI0036CDE31C
MSAGGPGRGRHLDPDGDGVGCERTRAASGGFGALRRLVALGDFGASGACGAPAATDSARRSPGARPAGAAAGKVCPEGASTGACGRKAAKGPRMGPPLLERAESSGKGYVGLWPTPRAMRSPLLERSRELGEVPGGATGQTLPGAALRPVRAIAGRRTVLVPDVRG